MTEVCAICREDLCQNTHTLECNHKYHPHCIIQWFRNGNSNCPLCNQIKLDPNINWYTKICCISEIKKLGRRKDCTKEIKKILENIKKLDLETKESNKKYASKDSSFSCIL